MDTYNNYNDNTSNYNSGETSSNKSLAILWAICLIPLIIGILLIEPQRTIYSTDEYWVAQGYTHVYERYSGKIVDYIENNETVQIKDSVIIVKKKSSTHGFGIFLTGFFGLCTLGMIWASIQSSVESSDWYKKTSDKYN